MNKQTETALKMAIEALESIELLCDDKRWYLIGSARKACKEALEQPAQEPFGYFTALPFGWTDCGKDDEGAIALYEHPAPSWNCKDKK